MQFHTEKLVRYPFGAAFVSRVCGEALQGRMPPGRLHHDGTRFRAVGLVGRANVHRQQRTLTIHCDVASASLDLFAPV